MTIDQSSELWTVKKMNLRYKILTSSTKIITGASLVAKEKRALVSFSASPNHYAKKGAETRQSQIPIKTYLEENNESIINHL